MAKKWQRIEILFLIIRLNDKRQFFRGNYWKSPKERSLTPGSILSFFIFPQKKYGKSLEKAIGQFLKRARSWAPNEPIPTLSWHEHFRLARNTVNGIVT
jgi:hypothetical protein